MRRQWRSLSFSNLWRAGCFGAGIINVLCFHSGFGFGAWLDAHRFKGSSRGSLGFVIGNLGSIFLETSVDRSIVGSTSFTSCFHHQRYISASVGATHTDMSRSNCFAYGVTLGQACVCWVGCGHGHRHTNELVALSSPRVQSQSCV